MSYISITVLVYYTFQNYAKILINKYYTKCLWSSHTSLNIPDYRFGEISLFINNILFLKKSITDLYMKLIVLLSFTYFDPHRYAHTVVLMDKDIHVCK